MDEKRFGQTIALLRKAAGLTQDELAERLRVSPQAVSKWENGHSLPETALLPEISRTLDVTLDELFGTGELSILEALYGDGIASVNVTKRLNRLVENDTLDITVSDSLLGAESAGGRAPYLTVKYQTRRGVCYAAQGEGGAIRLGCDDCPAPLPQGELRIIAGCYGTKERRYDVMQKIEHYRAFRRDSFRADHEVFPSDPANDGVEYLTLVYLNADGIHAATCAEGESLSYNAARTELFRQADSAERFIPGVPELPPFGGGMECSWAAALTAALQAMGADTSYDEVMGRSGACYRLAFCSPGWDYSSVDGLVAYDYAMPGYAAYGYTPEMYGRIEKAERAAHRERIAREIRDNMPVLGINLRVAPEWGVLCGYKNGGEVLYCRTKYDRPTIENDPQFMRGHPQFQKEWLGQYDTLQVDNWPFLLCYFTRKRQPPTAQESLIASLRVFVDCAAKNNAGGYTMGFKAYEVWAADLRDDAFHASCPDEQFARRFSVDQFCTLSLYDARTAAREYLTKSSGLLPGGAMGGIAEKFGRIAEKVGEIHRMLDSGEPLSGERCRAFWTEEKRHRQADLLDEAARIEREAFELAVRLLAEV